MPIPIPTLDSSLARGEASNAAGSGRAKRASILGEKQPSEKSTDSFWDVLERRRVKEDGEKRQPKPWQFGRGDGGKPHPSVQVPKSLTRESLDIDGILSGMKEGR